MNVWRDDTVAPKRSTLPSVVSPTKERLTTSASYFAVEAKSMQVRASALLDTVVFAETPVVIAIITTPVQNTRAVSRFFVRTVPEMHRSQASLVSVAKFEGLECVPVQALGILVQLFDTEQYRWSPFDN